MSRLPCQECPMRAMSRMPLSAPLPPGFKIIFDPTDEQIICDYLLRKVIGDPLPSDYVIECDLYGASKTWKKLFQERGENTIYVFTKLKKKNNKGSRIERVTDCGTWRSQKDTKIYSFWNNHKEKMHIGSRRNFTFVKKKKLEESDHEEKGVRWVMQEYRLDGCLQAKIANNNMGDYVLCRIKRKAQKEDEEATAHDEAPPMASFSDDIYRGGFWDMGNIQGNMNQVELPDIVWNAAQSFPSVVSSEVMNINAGSMYYSDFDSSLCLSFEELEDRKVESQELYLPVNFTGTTNAVIDQVAPPVLISDQGEVERLQSMQNQQQQLSHNGMDDQTVNTRDPRRVQLDQMPGFTSSVTYPEAYPGRVLGKR